VVWRLLAEGGLAEQEADVVSTGGVMNLSGLQYVFCNKVCYLIIARRRKEVQ